MICGSEFIDQFIDSLKIFIGRSCIFECESKNVFHLCRTFYFVNVVCFVIIKTILYYTQVCRFVNILMLCYLDFGASSGNPTLWTERLNATYISSVVTISIISTGP